MIFFKASWTLFLNKVSTTLPEYGCPLAKDLAKLVTNSESIYGDIGGSNGATSISIITGVFISLLNAEWIVDCRFSRSSTGYPILPQATTNFT